jgi:hypothetical protein
MFNATVTRDLLNMGGVSAAVNFTATAKSKILASLLNF